MGKTDYTKMENLLNEGLLKMSVKDLLGLADKATSFDDPTKPEELPSLQARTIILSLMKHDLETLAKVPGVSLEEAEFKPEDLKKILDHVKDLKTDEWEKLKAARERVLEYKKELWDQIPHLSDEQIVDLERKKHINKRFNTRDKWLPLH